MGRGILPRGVAEDLKAGPSGPWAGPAAELACRFKDLNPSPAARETPDHGRPGAGSTEAAGLSPAETSGPAMGDRERNKKRLLELLQAAGTGNGHCADCGAAGKGAVCGAGAASHGPGPWPTGSFPRSPSTRDSDSLLAWDPSPSRWRVSGGPDGPPSPCSRSPGPRSSLRIRCGPCPGSLSLSHRAPYPGPGSGHHLRFRALPAPSDPEVLTPGLRDPHCGVMTEDADVAGSGSQPLSGSLTCPLSSVPPSEVSWVSSSQRVG